MTITTDIVYLFTNTLYVYILCRFMRAFFGQRGKCRIVEICFYIAFYCVIAIVYLTFKNTAITVSTNIISYFILTFNYNAKIGYRFVGVVFIYAVLFSAETITLLSMQMLGMNHFSKFTSEEFLIAQISIYIVVYVVVLVFSNFKFRNKDYPIPLLYWVAIVAVPVGTVFPTFVITKTIVQDNVSIMIVSEIIILLINFFIFYLYDYITELYAQLMEKRLLEQQNSAYQKQLEIITYSQQKFKIFRHDMRHHLSYLDQLIKSKEYKEAEHYLKDIGNYLSTSQELVHTGNMAVDSIVNYLASVAEQKDIQLQCEIQIPEKLLIAAFDLNGIISNLLDNAVKVVELLPSDAEKIVKLMMHYERHVLYLTVENPCSKLAQKEAKEKGHGLGLQSVKMAVDKYNGIIKILTEPEIFQVEVLLYEQS